MAQYISGTAVGRITLLMTPPAAPTVREMDERMPQAGVTVTHVSSGESVGVLPEFLEWGEAAGELHVAEPTGEVVAFFLRDPKGHYLVEAPAADPVSVTGTFVLRGEDAEGHNLRFGFVVES